MAVGTERLWRFERVATFRVPMLAVVAVRFVVNEFKFEIVAMFRVPTLAVVDVRLVVREFRFEIW